MYSVTKRIDFCYGHRLLDYNGVCAHPHGHNGMAEIEVRSNAGVVLLKGRVESDEDKKRIMAAAQNVPGVKWVQNQVAVTPPPSPASSRGK